MNVLKNMEFVFVIAVALSFSAAAIAEQPKARAAKAPVAAASTKASNAANNQIITVVVPGKRLSKAEKAQLAAL